MEEITAIKAIEELASIENLEQLEGLLSRIDVSAPGSRTIFFSGSAPNGFWFGDAVDDMHKRSSDVRSIRRTEVSQFLDFDNNPLLAEKLTALIGGDVEEIGSPANLYLNGGMDADGNRIEGIWDRVSRRFAETASGDVSVLVSPKKEFGIFEMTELEVLLNNPNVDSIEGIPREQLLDLARKDGGFDVTAVKHAVAMHSLVRVEASGLLDGNVRAYLDFDHNQFVEYLKSPHNQAHIVSRMEALGVSGHANSVEGVRQLLEGGKRTAASGVPKYLNRMGFIGGALSFVLLASNAAAAETSEERMAIIQDWAVETAGSEIGSILAGAAAGIAVSAFAVAAPVAIPLTIAASLIGGFLGAEGAQALQAALISSEEAERRDMLRRYSKALFGDASDSTVDALPSQNAAFLMIDPSFSVDSMRMAAQSNLAWRYALVELNPFVVFDAPYAALHNRSGELDLFDSATGVGLTTEYLHARAEALQTRVAILAAGDRITGGEVFPGGYDTHYLDVSTDAADGTQGGDVDLHYLSDGFEQRLFGGSGDDRLAGGLVDDALFGGAGDDVLDGGFGVDYLEGGHGFDLYRAGPGDRVFDHDGAGSVLFAGERLTGGSRVAGSGAYVSADGAFSYELNGEQLQVTRTADGQRLTIDGYGPANLGIELVTRTALPPPTYEPHDGQKLDGHTLTGEHEDWHLPADLVSRDFDSLNIYNKPDEIIGSAGRDWVFAWYAPPTDAAGQPVGVAPDTDLVEGGESRDLIHGGPGDDRLYATDRADATAVMAGAGSLTYGGSGDDEGDLVSGQDGNDWLYGSGRFDGLFGGDGNDVIYAGAGNDLIFGGAAAYLRPDPFTADDLWFTFDSVGRPVAQLSYSGFHGFTSDDDQVFAGDGDDTVYGDMGHDRLDGGSGNDWIFGDSPDLDVALHGDDHIDGGAGNDELVGNAGDDSLFGGLGDDLLDGDAPAPTTLIGIQIGDDFLDGGPGRDTLVGGGGADILFGGEGDDALFGDRGQELDVLLHGNDRLYGGLGADYLAGGGGDDRLFGGDGNDRLFGDLAGVQGVAGDDYLAGGGGDDELQGGEGADVLLGGEGLDVLDAGDGDDLLDGGFGSDQLHGGDGNDRYYFAIGDSDPGPGAIDRLVDTPRDVNTVQFGDRIHRHDLRVTRDGDGVDLRLEYSTTDAMLITDGLIGSITAFDFSDGTSLGLESLLGDQLGALFGGVGTPDGDLLLGRGLQAEILAGDAGDDILIGGPGDDVLIGGPGSDTYVYGAGHGNDLIVDPSGFNLLRVVGIDAQQVQASLMLDTLRIDLPSAVLQVSDWAAGGTTLIQFDQDAIVSLDDVAAGAVSPGRLVTQPDPSTRFFQGTPGSDLIDLGGATGAAFGGQGRDTYRLRTDQAATWIIDDPSTTTLVVDGQPSQQVFLNVDPLQRDGRLDITVDGQVFARFYGGGAPHRLILPDGSVLVGIPVRDRLNYLPYADRWLVAAAAREGTALSWQLPADTFVDYDDALLNLRLETVDGSALPAWLSFDPASRMVSGTPGNGDVGSIALQFVASDKSGAEAVAAWRIDVEDVNDAPLVRRVPGVQQLLPGFRFALDLAAGIFADPDPGDQMSYSAARLDGAGLPAWLTLDPLSGVLEGVVPATGSEQVELLLRATDLAGESASTVVRLSEAVGKGGPVVRNTRIASVDELQFREIRAAGDLNGDGCDDLIVIGNVDPANPDLIAPSAKVRNMAQVLYGQAGGWSAAPANETVLYDYGNQHQHLLTDSNHQPLASGYSPSVISALGDLDGDGCGELAVTRMIGGHIEWTLVWGDHTPAPLSIDALPGSRLTRIDLGPVGEAASIRLPYAVNRLDINGDASPELLFGVTDGYASAAIGSLAIFENVGAWRGQSLDLAQWLAGADAMISDSGGGRLLAPRSIGDINADGSDELVVDLHFTTGKTGYAAWDQRLLVIAGSQAPLQDLDLAQVDPARVTEIQINGDAPFPDVAVHALGDVNADGIGDVAFTTGFGATHVMFGRGQFPAVVELTSLDGVDGFAIDWSQWTYLPYDGRGIASGDVTGDSIPDILLSRGAGVSGVEAARTYLIPGHAGTWPAAWSVAQLAANGTYAYDTDYRVDPTAAGSMDPPGGLEQIAVLDINGDGFDDLVKTVVDGDPRFSSLDVLYGSPTVEQAFIAGTDLSDTVELHGAGSAYTLAGSDQVRVVNPTGEVTIDSGTGDDTVTVIAYAASTPAAVVTVNGGAGDDHMILDLRPGLSGVSLGNLVLRGGAGADHYVVSNPGVLSGTLRIDDVSGGAGRNTLVLGKGYSSGGLRLSLGSLRFSFAGDGLDLHLANFDPLDVLEGPRDIDTFEFFDGSRLSYTQLVARGFDIDGTDAGETLSGTSVVDRLNGFAGDDILYGLSGDDVLAGGPGNDLLIGGDGADTYRFDAGDGRDTIDARSSASDHEAVDQLRFGTQVVAQELWFSRDDSDLLISRLGSDDRVRVSQWFGEVGGRLGMITDSAGMTILADDVDRLVQEMAIFGAHGGDSELPSVSLCSDWDGYWFAGPDLAA